MCIYKRWVRASQWAWKRINYSLRRAVILSKLNVLAAAACHFLLSLCGGDRGALSSLSIYLYMLSCVSAPQRSRAKYGSGLAKRLNDRIVARLDSYDYSRIHLHTFQFSHSTLRHAPFAYNARRERRMMWPFWFIGRRIKIQLGKSSVKLCQPAVQADIYKL